MHFALCDSLAVVQAHKNRYSERGLLTHAGPEDTREIDAQGEVRKGISI